MYRTTATNRNEINNTKSDGGGATAGKMTSISESDRKERERDVPVWGLAYKTHTYFLEFLTIYL